MTTSVQEFPTLREWANENEVPDNMLWKSQAEQQIDFVRNRLVYLFAERVSNDDFKKVVTVISTHTSKSIKLPVYKLELPDGSLTLILRYNFFNWKMSVISEKEIDADFTGLFHTTPPIQPDYTGDPLHHVYFEGFPKDLIFGYYSESDKKKWSAEIPNHFELWTTVYLIMCSLGLIVPNKWGTREDRAAR